MLDTISEKSKTINEDIKKIESFETNFQLPPAALAAANSYNHIMNSFLSDWRDTPLDFQNDLNLTFDEMGIPVQTRFGFSIRTSAQDESRFITDGFISREISETCLMLILAEHVSCFFDVGANVGYYSLLMSATGNDQIKCYAFEPKKSVFNRLNASTRDNHLEERVSAFNFAIGDKEEDATIKLSRQGSGGNTLCTNKNGEKDSGISEKVKTITLDGFIAKNGTIPNNSILKVDVEGYENKVISGATNFLTSGNPPIIMIEAFPKKVFSESHDATVLRCLKNLGYSLYRINEFRPGQTVIKPAFRAGRFLRVKNGNYIAFPKNQKKLENLCGLPVEASFLTSSRRLNRIIEFQERVFQSVKGHLQLCMKRQKRHARTS